MTIYLMMCGTRTVGITMYVRYCQVHEHLADSQRRLQHANKAALALGLMAAFGVSLVANFQVCSFFSFFSFLFVGSVLNLRF
jgi:hypothetical protein